MGSAKDAVFRSNEHFREAVSERERADVQELEHRLDRRARLTLILNPNATPYRHAGACHPLVERSSAASPAC